MTFPLILVMAAALPVAADSNSPFDQALTYETPWVMRGQSPEASGPVLSAPADGGVTTYYQGSPYGAGNVAPYGLDPFGQQGYPGPMTGDPWAGGVAPYAAPGQIYGVNGPQPHHMGWRARYDFTFMPGGSSQAPAAGDLDIFAFDLEKRLTTPMASNWIFQIAPQFNYRSFAGPDSSGGGPSLPGSAYRFGLDLVMQSPSVGGFSWEFAFNPAMGTDFHQSISSESFMYDGRAVLYWSWGPQVTWVLGAQYWDRVDDLLLPYAGVIWNPNQIWELQLLFPKSKISAFVGTPMGVATWIYATAEYHVEAYDMVAGTGPDSRRTQFEDWRVLGGLRWDSGWFESFAEAGYVFDRDVKFGGQPASNFNISSGFIGRVGFRY